MKELAGAAQIQFQKLGLKHGDSVLLADQISAPLYAAIMAVLGLGATVILVEPFLPVSEIDHIIQNLKPKVFVASTLGQLWGARVSSIRKIPNWIRAKALCSSNRTEKFRVESVSPDAAGIITFTSGTTGKSKGVVRTHAGLTAQNSAIRLAGNFEQYQKPDLAIFANLTLANLGMGRGTIFIPPKWRPRDIARLNSLPDKWKPETLSGGPAFLNHFLNQDVLPDLKSIHIGGALTDCSVFERGFKRFPNSRFYHVYGSSEAEPVSFSDARLAVEASRAKGYIQTLLLGNPIPEIKTRFEPEGLWVTGPHSCRLYIGNEEENKKTKLKDPDGTIWHFMGDRIKKEENGLWFAGRAQQSESDFKLEQQIYSFLGHTSCFLFREQDKLVLSGENLKKRTAGLHQKFPEIEKIQQKKIIRDRRHRARIDRGASR